MTTPWPPGAMPTPPATLLTFPPPAIVSVPAPALPTLRPELLVKVEFAPVTVTVPVEPAPLPMFAVKTVLLLTVPPFVIVSEPVPKLPILSPPLVPLIQLEPGPVTVTVPVEPAVNPTEPPPLFTVPPSWIVSVPVPWPPTTMEPALDQLAPAPVTVTVPSPPGRLPIVPKEVFNVPLGWMTSIPVPFEPTDRFWACAPGSLITVEFGVTVSMFALVVCVGTPASQLRKLNQPLENCPVQLVWACAETVDAAKSAIAASNLDQKNAQPASAPDVAPRRGPIDERRCGSRSILASPSSQVELAKQQKHNRHPGCRNCGDGEHALYFSGY